MKSNETSWYKYKLFKYKNSNIINSQITKTNDYKGVRQSAIYAIVEVINIIDILYSNMSI
jgi:hypothetical protein